MVVGAAELNPVVDTATEATEATRTMLGIDVSMTNVAVIVA